MTTPTPTPTQHPATKKTQVFETQQDFPFSELSVKKPCSVLGEPNHFLIQLLVGGNPIYIQTPPCQIKQGGFTKIGKIRCCDFVFSHDANAMVFLEWIERIEKYSQTALFENQAEWFDTKLTTDDVDNLFISPFKIFKSGNYYTLRTTIPLAKMKIFNEDEHEIPFDETFQTEQKTVAILEITGIKCSPRHFQMEIETKQMLLLRETPEPFSQWVGGKKQQVKPDITPPITEQQQQQPTEQQQQPTQNQPAVPLETAVETPSQEVPQNILDNTAGGLNDSVSNVDDVVVNDLEELVEIEEFIVDENNEKVEEEEENIHLDIEEFPDDEKKAREEAAEKQKLQELFVAVLEKGKAAKDLGIYKYLEQKGIVVEQEFHF